MTEEKNSKETKGKENSKVQKHSYHKGYESGKTVKNTNDREEYQKSKKDMKNSYSQQKTPEAKASFRKGFRDAMNGKPHQEFSSTEPIPYG